MKIEQIFEYQNVVFNQAFYSNNNIYGKIMYTIDSNQRFRVHLFKDLDDLRKVDLNNIEIPHDFVQTKQMTLKYED